jgi:hypothetical protein
LIAWAVHRWNGNSIAIINIAIINNFFVHGCGLVVVVNYNQLLSVVLIIISCHFVLIVKVVVVDIVFVDNVPVGIV